MKELTKRKREGLAWPGNLGKLHEEMDRLFMNFFGESPMQVVGSCPVDVKEDDKHVYVDAELPGMSKNELEVTVENGILTISGEKKIEKKEGEEDLRERYYGRMYRSLTLPSHVDENKVKATMKDGVLHVVLEKKEAERPKRIEIE
ncbi:MAG: hypothetical protein A2Y12_04030 [Planctomycetes bacterium GWF2_42_9]|nr:MAG: hypothetical protein A2Y12_04030 [Planctomycetes bacterium GWF2_42_9]